MTSRSQDESSLFVATIGVFDGVHLGHQALIGRVVQRAAELRVGTACITFSPHPEDVLRPRAEIAHLAALQDRLDLLEQLGIARVEVFEFTPSLARLSPEEFLELLLSRLSLKELWVGSDFALGRDRAGGPERLAAIGRARGFEVCQFPPVRIRGAVVSSTLIRLLLTEGQVEEAGLLLGRSYRLRGSVVVGDRRGKSLGFATANLSLQERLCVPGDGVYAVRCLLHGSPSRAGVANVGVRPTFGGERRQIEVHLIGFEGGELYGQELVVDFVARLRGECRFESAEALASQIAEDVGRAKALLA